MWAHFELVFMSSGVDVQGMARSGVVGLQKCIPQC